MDVAAADRSRMLLTHQKNGNKVFALFKLSRIQNAMQTRKPTLKSIHDANCSLQASANISKKAGRVDAPLVDRHLLAVCAAVNDAGMAQE